jgi:hypothetical protein
MMSKLMNSSGIQVRMCFACSCFVRIVRGSQVMRRGRGSTRHQPFTTMTRLQRAVCHSDREVYNYRGAKDENILVRSLRYRNDSAGKLGRTKEISLSENGLV